ncbi:MAG: Uncharacterised protein [Cellulomonadaceae bacterium TMED98]|nr:MAG: Uncharacterised protein [Cellulomonadaceae bacterium TMED98]
MVVNRPVGQRPVHAEAQRAPEVFELFFVFDGEGFTELNKVPPTNRHGLVVFGAFSPLKRGSEGAVVGEGGVASHPVVVLHPALGRQPVIVPPHGVEDFLAPHALVSGLQVHMGVAEDVANMQTAGGSGWRSVDGEDAVGAPGHSAFSIEPVGALALPPIRPGRLEPL